MNLDPALCQERRPCPPVGVQAHRPEETAKAGSVLWAACPSAARLSRVWNAITSETLSAGFEIIPAEFDYG